MKTSLLAAVCALTLGVSPPGTGTTPPGTGPAVPGPGGTAPMGPGLVTPGAGPVDGRKPLTPNQIIRDKVEGSVRVEFTVGEYGQILPPRRDATTPSVVVILEPKSVEGATYRLQVYVTEKVLARLGQLGIENLHTHLYGKVVRVSGSVKRVDYDKGGGYCHLVVENLDQFELIGAQPGSGTTPPENPVPLVIAVPGSGPTPPGTGPAVPGPGRTGPGLGTRGAVPADEKKVLTPEQIFRDNFVGERRVEFTVGAVSFGGSPFDMEEATNRPRVETADGKFSVSRLRVIVAKKVEARLKQLGIEDLRRHFYGKVVRVSGDLKQEIDAGGVGNRLITYSLTIDSLDQLEIVGKK